jgi:hypothetical protein
MIRFIIFYLLLGSFVSYSQPWTSNGTCDFSNGVQWNSGGSTPCACTWYSIESGDTILNCAFGDCGQADFLECFYDCNGHNGNPTDMIPRQCDASGSPTPICWYQGAGSTAGVDFCNGVSLPVEFMGMDGYTNGSFNIIEWQTASEYNSSHFIVERSVDGKHYSYVSTVPSVGNTVSMSSYRAIDTSPSGSVVYYRLTQYDFDGLSEVLGFVVIDGSPRFVISIIDVMGRTSDMSGNGLRFIYYSNGTVSSVWLLGD